MFGHAGAIVDDTMVVCDGVKVEVQLFKRRQYAQVSQCYMGIIDPTTPLTIDWQAMPHFSGKGLYRMAATGLDDKKWLVFAGGSDNPYNYNGIGYNGEPSEPSSSVYLFDVQTKKWRSQDTAEMATMDHRGLLHWQGQLLIIGGMGENQRSLAEVTKIPVTSLK